MPDEVITETTTEQKEKPVAKYTDEDMNNLTVKAKAEAVAGMLKDLGVESTGKLKDDLKALREIQDKGKTEAERLATSVKEATEKLTAAEQRAVAAETKAEAMALGVDPKKIERAVKLIATYDGETAAQKVAAFLSENPEFKTATGGQNFGGKSKDQGAGDDKATMTAALEAAMGIKNRAT